MTNYNELQGLDLETVKAEIGFKVKRQSLSTSSSLKVDRDAIIVPKEEDDGQGNKVIRDHVAGVVKKNHKYIPYTDSIQWVWDAMNNLGIEFKIKESVLNDRGDLYQEYVLNSKIETPDDLDVSPMLLLRASYVGAPLAIEWGNFRFVCSNGVKVGTSLGAIHVKRVQETGILIGQIKDDLQRGLEGFSGISEKYAALAEMPLTEVLPKILTFPSIGPKTKIGALDVLQDGGKIRVVREKITREDFSNPTALYELTDDTATGWDTYNAFTEAASHKVKSVGMRNYVYSQVSKAFAI